jgi:hypothetical protein
VTAACNSVIVNYNTIQTAREFSRKVFQGECGARYKEFCVLLMAFFSALEWLKTGTLLGHKGEVSDCWIRRSASKRNAQV